MQCILQNVNYARILHLKYTLKYTNAAVCLTHMVSLNRFNLLPFTGLADNKFSAEGGNRVSFKSLCHYIDCVIQVIIPVDSSTNFHLLSKILFKLLPPIS